MQYLERITAIEKRAQAVNLTLRQVCVRAGLHPATVHRWQSGETSPIARTVDEYAERLEQVLGQIEGEVLASLLERRAEQRRRSVAL